MLQAASYAFAATKAFLSESGTCNTGEEDTRVEYWVGRSAHLSGALIV